MKLIKIESIMFTKIIWVIIWTVIRYGWTLKNYYCRAGARTHGELNIYFHSFILNMYNHVHGSKRRAASWKIGTTIEEA